jgi:hypothetical protein
MTKNHDAYTMHTSMMLRLLMLFAIPPAGRTGSKPLMPGHKQACMDITKTIQPISRRCSEQATQHHTPHQHLTCCKKIHSSNGHILRKTAVAADGCSAGNLLTLYRGTSFPQVR